MATETDAEKARLVLEGSHGTARDADEAVALLKKEVQHGNADAMWILGVCCEFGIGTEQDEGRAEQLFQKAAQQGNTTAMLLLDEPQTMGCEQSTANKQHSQPKKSIV